MISFRGRNGIILPFRWRSQGVPLAEQGSLCEGGSCQASFPQGHKCRLLKAKASSRLVSTRALQRPLAKSPLDLSTGGFACWFMPSSAISPHTKTRDRRMAFVRTGINATPCGSLCAAGSCEDASASFSQEPDDWSSSAQMLLTALLVRDTI